MAVGDKVTTGWGVSSAVASFERLPADDLSPGRAAESPGYARPYGRAIGRGEHATDCALPLVVPTPVDCQNHCPFLSCCDVRGVVIYVATINIPDTMTDLI